MYFGDDGGKELVIICDHVHFSRENEWTKDASCFLKERGRGEIHVTLIQEMNGQWEVSLSGVSGINNPKFSLTEQLELLSFI